MRRPKPSLTVAQDSWWAWFIESLPCHKTPWNSPRESKLWADQQGWPQEVRASGICSSNALGFMHVHGGKPQVTLKCNHFSGERFQQSGHSFPFTTARLHLSPCGPGCREGCPHNTSQLRDGKMIFLSEINQDEMDKLAEWVPRHAQACWPLRENTLY